METHKSPISVFNFLTHMQENGCGYVIYSQPVTGEVQFFHWYSSSMLCFGWRNLPFLFPKPFYFLYIRKLLAHTTRTCRSHREARWWNGRYLSSVYSLFGPTLFAPPVFGGLAELFAKARSAAVETANPCFPQAMGNPICLEALLRGAVLTG